METFNDMLFELHQDKTFCKSVVKVSTNVSIEWLDVQIVIVCRDFKCFTEEAVLMFSGIEF